MKIVSEEIQLLSIESLKSTLRKLENAYKRMTENHSNTTLVKKRRDAVKIGLDSLENAWHGTEFSYDEEAIRSAKLNLQSLLPSIQKQYVKAKEGSAQKTIIERRITAIELAIEALEKSHD
ncbi:hypothetical protein SAMN04488137_3483 [Fictibacillus solisalsi]|uniref:Uncharacterized protein n=1 Tax=Fictibacillus solisalsi TaxID=459525 RepID=A0A1G9YL76_9BACL|nr:hypothetical protein [Fictibacillus solisalsi]SDN09251.1 hypothetical protein SAMN04488137_3483 [Fictibacillus solisalsi]